MTADNINAIPAYQRIRDSLRARIASGQFKEGDRLPSESQLIKEFGVVRMTVRQALSQLVFENLIVTRPGLGSFIAAKKTIVAAEAASRQSFEAQISAQGQTLTLKLLSFKRIAASPEVAERLQIAPSENIYCLERLRFIDDQLIGLEVRYLLEQVGRRIPASGIDSMPTLDLLEEALDEQLGSITLSIFAAAADKQVATKMQIRRGAPVLVREHVVLDQAERVVLFGTSMYRGNLHFHHVFRDAPSAARKSGATGGQRQR